MPSTYVSVDSLGIVHIGTTVNVQPFTSTNSAETRIGITEPNVGTTSGTDTYTATNTDRNTNTVSNTTTRIATRTNIGTNTGTSNIAAITTAPHTATGANTILADTNTATGTNTVAGTGDQPQALIQTAAHANAVTTASSDQYTVPDVAVSNVQTTTTTQTLAASASPKAIPSDTVGHVGSSRAFFKNTYAIAGIFAVVSLAIVIVTIAIVANTFRWCYVKKRNRGTVHAPAFVDENHRFDGRLESGVDGSDADLYSLYSDATYSTFFQSPMSVTDESYDTRELAPYDYSVAASELTVHIDNMGLVRGAPPSNAFEDAPPARLYLYEDVYEVKQRYRAPGPAAAWKTADPGTRDEHPGRCKV
ncbi:hypothetical protein GY45DRAFT_1431540 [Cubamyces sp. BRFM 1775]|nr:hypothetical protein GY45DRAFT_1431540 [Cubamyces sp. BRFM 1775]